MRCGVWGGGCFTSHSLPTRYRMMIMRACVCHTKPLIQHLAAHTVQHQKRARARVKNPHKKPGYPQTADDNGSGNVTSHLKCVLLERGARLVSHCRRPSVPASGLNICTCDECVTVPGKRSRQSAASVEPRRLFGKCSPQRKRRGPHFFLFLWFL